MGPSRREQIERVLDSAGIREQQGSLAEVIEQQTRQDNSKPAKTDRQAAKMAHIRVHCFPTGNGEEDRAEHGERDPRRSLGEVRQGMMRA